MNPFCKNTKQLSIFVTAGYPKIDSLPQQIQFLAASGIDFIEVGIPFSDPMADGPTIQESSDIALQNGMNVALLFDQLSSIETSTPLVIMSYFNPILHFGLERFLQQCNATQIRFLIVPDISLEIYDNLYRSLFEKYEITLCFLVTPETSSERITQMSKASTNGFIYLVSSSMTTGNSVQRVGEDQVRRIRSAACDVPLMIGFGIQSREDVQAVHKIADGAIIGSAYIRALQEKREHLFISELSAPAPQSL